MIEYIPDKLLVLFEVFVRHQGEQEDVTSCERMRTSEHSQITALRAQNTPRTAGSQSQQVKSSFDSSKDSRYETREERERLGQLTISARVDGVEYMSRVPAAKQQEVHIRSGAMLAEIHRWCVSDWIENRSSGPNNRTRHRCWWG